MTIDAELQRRAARLVEREVYACLSSLVATLAQGVGRARSRGHDALTDLSEQAQELASPVLDYEGAAREAGWITDYAFAEPLARENGYTTVGLAPGLKINPAFGNDENGMSEAYDGTWEGLCDWAGIEPHELEVFEHWAVSQWLAEKLIAKGERVDTDFAGLNVWARTTTGQAISMDSVIEAVASETGYASGGEA